MFVSGIVCSVRARREMFQGCFSFFFRFIYHLMVWMQILSQVKRWRYISQLVNMWHQESQVYDFISCLIEIGISQYPTPLECSIRHHLCAVAKTALNIRIFHPSPHPPLGLVLNLLLTYLPILTVDGTVPVMGGIGLPSGIKSQWLSPHYLEVAFQMNTETVFKLLMTVQCFALKPPNTCLPEWLI